MSSREPTPIQKARRWVASQQLKFDLKQNPGDFGAFKRYDKKISEIFPDRIANRTLDEIRKHQQGANNEEQ